MSDSLSHLPERPSLEQLRKQAKELLRDCRSGDATAIERVRRHKIHVTNPSLADAQFAVAREYGFESWPKLVQHVTSSLSSEISNFADIAHDLVAAYGGDADALARINKRTGEFLDAGRLRQ